MCSSSLFYLTIFSAVLANEVVYRRKVLFTIRPGKVTCFVKMIDRFGNIRVQYQVVEKRGGIPRHSVSFYVNSSEGWVSGSAWRWPAGVHTLLAPTTGQYRFCFDNSFDLRNKKTILFKLSVLTKNKTLENVKERRRWRSLLPPGVKDLTYQPAFTADSRGWLKESLEELEDNRSSEPDDVEPYERIDAAVDRDPIYSLYDSEKRDLWLSYGWDLIDYA